MVMFRMWGATAAQLLWPARCAACDVFVPDDVIFCGDCNLSVDPLVGVCPGCALPDPWTPCGPGADAWAAAWAESSAESSTVDRLGATGRACREPETTAWVAREPTTAAQAASTPRPQLGDRTVLGPTVRGASGSPGDRCARCLRVPFPFCNAAAGFEYGAALRDAIVRMKHGRRRELARRLGRLLAPSLGQVLRRWPLGPDDAIVPVPLHGARLRRRGFNQALEMARAALGLLARHPTVVGRRLPALQWGVLRRTRSTRELGHSGPGLRLAEVAGAFSVGDPGRVRGRRLLLIDDVFTTGATFSECTETLLAAGAREVHVLALARAV